MRKIILRSDDTQTVHMNIYLPSLSMVKRELSFKPVVLKLEPASESMEGLVKIQIVESHPPSF